jgi:hypothetical protein
MNLDDKSPSSPQQLIKRKERFPRYPTAKEIGELVKNIWERPTFDVRQTSKKTEFVFSLPFNLQRRIKTRGPAPYIFLFTGNRDALQAALPTAFERARYGKRDRVKNLIERALFKTVVEALTILFQEVEDTLGPYKCYIVGTSEDLSDAAKRKKRPLASEREVRACRCAKRYEQLLPQVKSLREFIRKNRNEESLLMRVEEQFSQEWMREVIHGDALKRLPEITGHSGQDELTGLWTTRQLAIGILWCEESSKDPTLAISPNTILGEYIPLGKKLIRFAKKPDS